MSDLVRPSEVAEAAARSSASFRAALAYANGWDVREHRDVVALAEPRRPRAVMTSDAADRGDIVELMDDFWGSEKGPYLLEDHWARTWTAGFTRVRADPIMLRPAGPIDEPLDHGLEIRAVRTPNELGQFEEVLVEAMPIAGVDPDRAGALFRPAVLTIELGDGPI